MQRSSPPRPNRKGDVEVIAHDLRTGRTTVSELADRLQLNDHDSPVFTTLADGSLLALFSRHGNDNRICYRRTASPFDPWTPLQVFVPSDSSRVTYSNLFVLAAEGDRIYDFFRGLHGEWKPSYAYSDDGGRSWSAGNIVIRVPTSQRHRPYVRYASNNVDTIHLFYTEGHPRNYDNSVYHAFYRNGFLHRSDGQAIASLKEGLSDPREGTLIFQGNPDQVAWTTTTPDGTDRGGGITSWLMRAPACTREKMTTLALQHSIRMMPTSSTSPPTPTPSPASP